MGKTYLDIVKYMISADFKIDGLVDKPDIIGAVFGQTEGLLGDDLDLRELQKNGKIGRIEIESSQSQNRTFGKLLLPASLDRVETCILAAAVESVDRVGPYDAGFKVEKVEDTRSAKRQKLLTRAKELLSRLISTEMPDSKELAELVQSDVKAGEIMEYGQEKLPAGPDVANSKEVMLVEGRADVLNLLKSDITNAIAIGGATAIPKTIINLARDREITVFLDGDRGGDMILRNLLSVCNVDFVAKAPEGKEVEELQRKEIIKAIRSKVPLDQYLENNKNVKPHNYHEGRFKGNKQYENKHNYGHNEHEREQPTVEQQRESEHESSFEQDYANMPSSNAPHFDTKHFEKKPEHNEEKVDDFAEIERIEYQGKPTREEHDAKMEEPLEMQIEVNPAIESAILSELATSLDKLSGTLRSRIYSTNGDMVKELPIRELINYMQELRAKNVYGVVLDGVITQRLVELALQKRIRAVYGIKANPMPRKHPDIIIYTKEAGKLE